MQSSGNQIEHQYNFGHVYHVDIFDFCSKLSLVLNTIYHLNEHKSYCHFYSRLNLEIACKICDDIHVHVNTTR